MQFKYKLCCALHIKKSVRMSYKISHLDVLHVLEPVQSFHDKGHGIFKKWCPAFGAANSVAASQLTAS